MQLFVDGTPRGDPKYRTYLEQPLSTYERQTGISSFLEDRERFINARHTLLELLRIMGLSIVLVFLASDSAFQVSR